MNRTAIVATTLLAAMALPVLAGGDPEYVGFPDGYTETFAHYATVNRANGKQVAKLYANDVAVESYRAGAAAGPGAVIVMEIYPAALDESENPVVGDDGLFEHKDLAAIAVMEKSDSWPEAFSAATRAGDWGFALYGTQGSPKDNDLACYTCHTPQEGDDGTVSEGDDNIFTFQFLKDHASGS